MVSPGEASIGNADFLLPLREKICPVLFGALQQILQLGLGRRSAPLLLEHVASVSQKVNADFPLANLLSVKMGRPVISRVEPQVEADDFEGFDPWHV